MWRPLKVSQLKRAVRCTLPDLSMSNSLEGNRSQLHRASVLKPNQDLSYVPGDAITQMCWATHSTKRELSCRREELSRWQTQASESIGQVDQEITALEQVKDAAECCLQEKILHHQVQQECMVLRDNRITGSLVQDHVQVGLTKEVQLTEEIKELVQKQIYMLLDKLSSLREIRSQLLADYRDKGEAMKLNTKCITYDLRSPNVHYQYQPNQTAKGSRTLTYDQWLSHCKGLKLTAEKLVMDCSYFRRNLQYILAKLTNALENQRCATDGSLRRKIKEMIRATEVLEWEKQQVKDTIMDLVRDMQMEEAHLMSCGLQIQLAQTRLDILKQRPSRELCLDKSHISLMLETRNLAKIVSGLRTKLQLSHCALKSMRKNLSVLEDRLADTARALNVDKKCQYLRQCHLTPCGTAVVIANKPKLLVAPDHSGPFPSLQ